MDAVFKTVLSMSASGTLLILLLLAARPLIKNRLSRQWLYYISGWWSFCGCCCPLDRRQACWAGPTRR